MQLSLHADYGCRVLIYLASSDTEIASVEQIALAFRISQNHLVKVVHHLAKLGFVETMRGRGGGIRLAREPDQISIGDVIRRMEPSFEIVECFNLATNTCPIVSACGLMPALGRAREAFLRELDAVALSEVLKSRADLARILSEPRAG